MTESSYNIATRINENEAYASGIAYVVIPSDVDRGKYIKECYATNTVSIYSEHNGFNNRVPIDKYSLNFIVFPSKIKEFGSPVSFKCDPITNLPVVDGIYFSTDEISELREHQFKFKRKLGNNVVEIVGSPEGKYVGINVIAESEGEVFINVKSKDQSGVVNISVDGSVNINSAGNLTLSQHNRFKCITSENDNEDQYSIHEQTSTEENFANDNHNIYTNNFTVVSPKNHFREVEEFKINDGEEPYVLGKKFSKFMKNFIDELGAITTTTMLGAMPIINKAQVIAFKEQVDDLLSEIVFIDK